MAKYDAVDRLMAQANEPAREAGGAPDAEAVLEEKVSAAEPQAPRVAATPAAPPPRVAAGERARNLLGALRPMLPAVGGALRMVDHGAVQAVARLLPLLGGVGTGLGSSATAPAAEPAGQLAELLHTLERQQAAMAAGLSTQSAAIATSDDQIRKLRDALARVSSEQNVLVNSMDRIQDRSRLLAAAVVILLLLVLAEMAMLFVFLHH